MIVEYSDGGGCDGGDWLLDKDVQKYQAVVSLIHERGMPYLG